MAERSLKLGQRVEVTGKDVKGSVAYIGSTMFSTGKWIGIILDEPKGKNNGSVQGKTYFQCQENYGMFVRQSQLTFLDEPITPASDMTSSASGTTTPTTPGDVDPRKTRLTGISIRRRTQPTTVRRKTSPPAHSARSRLDKSRSGPSRRISSRLSLVSSRSQSDFPNKDDSGKDASTPSASEPTSKRASFIEKSLEPDACPLSLTESSQTGFVETLKPQYIPGPAMVSPGASMSMSMSNTSTVEERLTHLQIQQEMEGLRAENQDLKEKLETLRAKRQQDKEKLKELDKLRLQLEQMVEFKTKIMESQASLQRDLQRARQEAREAIEAREQHAEEMADLAETVEMATLDKEMAEEKSESLQLELEQVRERLEEVTLDLEIIKAEMSEKPGGEGVAPSSFELKQCQQQNVRLKETLVRMRDLSAHEKHEASKIQKELDQRKSEVMELQRTKEKLSYRVEEQEHQIADLQEQVDAALGAEEMVQQLVDSKLELEEKVKVYQETIAELEELQDMNEQLQEGSRELEVELREELDLAEAQTRQAQRELEAMHETLADRDVIIGRFRELVQRQREEQMELRTQLQQETNKPDTTMPADVLEFEKMFAKTKAHTKAIDLELRRLDVLQANEHVRYLTAYMPESFMVRGGDNDAILLLLLVPRLIQKAEILLAQLRDKFPSIEKVDRSAVSNHSAERFAYRCCFSFHLHYLQTILQQFLHVLTVCTPEELLKIGMALPDLAAQERALETFLHLLKIDQLDENVRPEPIEKAVNYFEAVCPNLSGAPPRPHHSLLVLTGSRALQAACDAMVTQAAAITSVLQVGSEVGEIGLLAQHVASQGEALIQQLKQARRRLPMETVLAELGLSTDLMDGLHQSCSHAGRIIRTLQCVVHAAVQRLGTGEDGDGGISHDLLLKFATLACDNVYEKEDRGPMESIKTSLAFISGEVNKLSQFLSDNEHEIRTKFARVEEKPVAPIILRAQTMKKELEETKTLRHKLEMKDSDCKELKLSLKLKQEELSEMTIRKDMAEKKLGTSNRDHELAVEKLQRKVDDLQQLLKRKEKEFEETMDHLQKDIDSLESEKGLLREKCKNMSKKALYDVMTKPSLSSSPQQQTQLSMGSSSLTGIGEAVRDSPLLIQRLHELEAALELMKDENWKLQTQIMSHKLYTLSPLQVVGYTPEPKTKEEWRLLEYKKQQDIERANLIKKGRKLLLELRKMNSYKVPDMMSSEWFADPEAAFNKHNAQLELAKLNAKKKASAFLEEISQEIIKSKQGGNVEADFATFPTPEMTKAYGKTEMVSIGKIRIPSKEGKSGVIKVPLTPDSLMQLHSSILTFI